MNNDNRKESFVAKIDTRYYGLDLLKILAMFMVLILHILSASNLLQDDGDNDIYRLAWAIEIMAFCAVNCYAIITGYLNIDKKYSSTNLIYLYLQIIVYTISITLVYMIISGNCDIALFIEMIFPMLFGEQWYFTSYFWMFLFIPFLNKALVQVTEKESKYLFSLIVGACTILPIIYSRAIINGYSFYWLIVCYIIGACIKKAIFLAS